uniref:TonB-dependent receptor n=3 Tax=Aquisalinus luteolus TaxID=1566827 RepID=A0A8J3EPR1_9PROT|nr:TonB-dependent receptor [Aquisalinus luteolus]
MTQKSNDTRLWAMAGASTLVLGVMGAGFVPTMAYAQDDQVATEVEDDEDEGDVLVITGQRQALETAADLKRESDTIGDSLVLDEAGKIPSTSLLEILERAPGVTMNRIRAGSEGSPDGFAFEGSGVQVRGLNKTKTLINGREVFSANGGSGLSWADVGPELLKTVTIYKASRADLIEGGVSGTVNLVTAMPFDHDGFKGSAAVTADYGDYSEEITPAGSIMLSNRWDTGIGEIGVLVDLAYSKIASHDSNIIIPPFYATEFEGERVYVPGGVRYTQDQFERTRNGYYGAIQWRPTDNLEFFHTTFISERESNRESQIMGPEPGTPWGVFPGAVFDENNVFVSGSIGSTNLTSGQAVAMNSSFTPGFSKTADYSTGFKYEGEGWDLSGSYQYVDAESRSGKYSIGLAVIPQIVETEVDLTGDVPYFNFVDELSTDPAQAGGSRINWLDTSNEGNAHAFQLDASFDLSDDGFFRKAQIGGRIADREESDSFVGTWWSPTGRGWNGVPRAFASTAPDGDFYLEDFDDFFKGDVEPLGSVWIPTRQVNSSDQFDRVYDTYTACGPDLYYQCSNPDTTTYLYGSDPRNRNFDQLPSMYTTEADTQSAYAMVGFANDGAGWMNFSGNLGVRWVNYDVSSMGNFNFNGGATFFESEADQQAFIDSIGGIENLVDWEEANENTPYPGTLETIGFSDDISGSFEKDYFLPSFNVKFEPQDGWIARYALTQTLTPPRYPDIRAQGIASAQTVDSTLNDEIREYWLANGADTDEQATSIPGVFNGYTNTSGNPTLEPEVSLNHDVSVEWYPRRGSTVYLSLFHKTIDNYITFDNASFAASSLFSGGTTPQTAPLVVNSDPTQPPVVDPSQSFFLDGAVTSRQNTNADSDTIIRGFELGGRTYFDNLPGAWSGFGVTGNVTYIDNDAPDAFARDINGDVLNVPVVGLSKWAYSATLLYDYEKVSARLAYNWRDRYLATTNDSGTTNTYTDYTGEVIQFGLPVYSAEQERLDGSVSYQLTDRMNIKFNVQNILDQEQRTETELLDNVFVDRAVFVTDRRYSLHLGFDF